MKVRRIIGIALIVAAAVPIYNFHTLRKETQKAYEAALVEVIFSSNQIELNESASFETTYRHAHGIVIKNATEVESEDASDLNIKLPYNKSAGLKFSEGSECHTYNGPITASKRRDFDGEIVFMNSVCGCENLGPFMFFLGSLALGFILVPIGLYLLLKKNPERPKQEAE